MKKVFLGGTCAETVWREKLISMLKIDYFNPVVPDWTEECMKQERYEREHDDYCLYVITPSMQGVYSIAEDIDDSNKRPQKTIFEYFKEDVHKYEHIYEEVKKFNKAQIKSLDQVGKMVERNGGKYFTSLEEVAEYLNK